MSGCSKTVEIKLLLDPVLLQRNWDGKRLVCRNCLGLGCRIVNNGLVLTTFRNLDVIDLKVDDVPNSVLWPKANLTIGSLFVRFACFQALLFHGLSTCAIGTTTWVSSISAAYTSVFKIAFCLTASFSSATIMWQVFYPYVLQNSTTILAPVFAEASTVG